MTSNSTSTTNAHTNSVTVDVSLYVNAYALVCLEYGDRIITSEMAEKFSAKLLSMNDVERNAFIASLKLECQAYRAALLDIKACRRAMLEVRASRSSPEGTDTFFDKFL